MQNPDGIFRLSEDNKKREERIQANYIRTLGKEIDDRMEWQSRVAI